MSTSWKTLLKRIKREITGASLVVWWWGIHLPMQGTQIPSLRQEDPTCCTAVLQGSNFCTSLPTVASSFFSFYSSHSNRCEVVSCCGLFLFLFVWVEPWSLRDLSSLTRDWTWNPLNWGCRVLATGPGKSWGNILIIRTNDITAESHLLYEDFYLIPSKEWAS